MWHARPLRKTEQQRERCAFNQTLLLANLAMLPSVLQMRRKCMPAICWRASLHQSSSWACGVLQQSARVLCERPITTHNHRERERGTHTHTHTHTLTHKQTDIHTLTLTHTHTLTLTHTHTLTLTHAHTHSRTLTHTHTHTHAHTQTDRLTHTHTHTHRPGMRVAETFRASNQEWRKKGARSLDHARPLCLSSPRHQ